MVRRGAAEAQLVRIHNGTHAVLHRFCAFSLYPERSTHTHEQNSHLHIAQTQIVTAFTKGERQ